ncbi:MAG TPA: putative glycolipid-binding domain-containing protein [Stellaceae bacterium]|nr:putative glycolipid-binding domain-containing protein [Stellaceae bacterium]
MTAAREILWRRTLDGLSFEHLRIGLGTDGPELAGTVLIAEAGMPLRVEYRIACDAAWRTRSVEITQTHAGTLATLRLDHDLAGTWRRNGTAAPDLDGCSDVDLGVSPSTNALPINRLGLPPGGSARIRAAWVLFPGLEVVAAEQDYERLGAARYRYRSVASGFEAAIDVDEEGFPIDYAGIWQRLAAGPIAPPLPRL